MTVESLRHRIMQEIGLLAPEFSRAEREAPWSTQAPGLLLPL